MKATRLQFGVVISPWVDLECKDRSYVLNGELDTVLSQPYLMEAAKWYSMGHALSCPFLSPINSDLSELAPMLVLCGTHEILQDASVILHQHL